MVSRILSASLWLPDPSQKGSRGPKGTQKWSNINDFVIGFLWNFSDIHHREESFAQEHHILKNVLKATHKEKKVRHPHCVWQVKLLFILLHYLVWTSSSSSLSSAKPLRTPEPLKKIAAQTRWTVGGIIYLDSWSKVCQNHCKKGAE